MATPPTVYPRPPHAPLVAVRIPHVGGRRCARQMAQEVVDLHKVALFVSTYYFVFLLTTVAGVYRWIFQVRNRSGLIL